MLVIDEDQQLRRLFNSAFSRHGYRVLIAAPGREAEDLFRSFSAVLSAVLLDEGLVAPGTRTTLDIITEHDPSVPIIFVTGYGEDIVRKGLAGKSVAAILQKPFTTAQISRTVRDVIQQRALVKPSSSSSELSNSPPKN